MGESAGETTFRRLDRDRVEVRGLPYDQVVEAIERYQASEEGVEYAIGRASGTVEHLVGDVTVPPPAALAQARRRAQRRVRLLSEGALAVEQIAELRETSLRSAQSWLSRAKRERRLFTVTWKGQQLIPGFQLDADGRPDPRLRPLLEIVIDERGLEEWAVWSWFALANAALGGERPQEALDALPPDAAPTHPQMRWLRQAASTRVLTE